MFGEKKEVEKEEIKEEKVTKKKKKVTKKKELIALRNFHIEGKYFKVGDKVEVSDKAKEKILSISYAEEK